MRKSARRLLGLSAAVAVMASLLAPASPALAAAPANDDIESFATGGFPVRESWNNADATVQAGEPAPCGGMSRTGWYAMRVVDGTRVTASTLHSTSDTVLAVYEAPATAGVGFDDLTLLDCNDDDDFSFFQSTVNWNARPGYSYYLQLGAGSRSPRGGDVTLVVDPADGYGPGGKEPDTDLEGRSSTVLESGQLQLGVNDTGNLVARDTNIGLVYTPTGNDALSPGCPCEGWGLLDEQSGAHGSIGESSGRTGDLRLVDFQVDGTRSAVSVVDVGGVMRVRQKVRPALGHPELFELAIEVKNISDVPQLPLYRRTMDWDIGPTEFDEYVTIAGDVGGSRGEEPKVVYTSDDGFASPDPSYGRSSIREEGTFTDSGPDDHGALIDIALPQLQPGAVSTFSIYYGAAGNERDITLSLQAAGTAVYSTASPSSPGGLELGTPNTYGFGFRLHDSRYVAMGDSFQSGEGAPGYEDGTDTEGPPENRCHRSLKAYSRLVFEQADVASRMTFSACSGAVIEDLYDRDGDDGGAPWNENAQIEDAGGDTTLITVGIGGNDVKFADTLTACIIENARDLLLPGERALCHETSDSEVNGRIDEITLAAPGELSILQQLYSDLRERAPRARILVLGYPRFFRNDVTGGVCEGVRWSDQLWINEKIDQFNEAIRRNVTEMGMEYVDVYDVPQDHELCSAAPVEEQFLNGIVPLNVEHSYHPKTYGHARLAEAVLGQLRDGVAGDATYTMQPDNRIYTTRNVAPGSDSLSASATWPGSDIDLSLMSPSGVVYSRRGAPAGAHHEVGPTSELWTIPDPEPGQWTVRMHAVDVDDEGEPVLLRTGTTSPANAAPTASFTSSVQGRTVTVDASASADADGTVADYAWDFGDVVLHGAKVSYTYPEDGDYRVGLVVTDAEGARGFAAQSGIVATGKAYDFDGFRPPVSSSEINRVVAGQTIPIKFALRDADGIVVTSLDAVSAYGFDGLGPAAAYTLEHDGEQYVLRADTPKAWASSTRTFTLRLDDGTTHTARFAFK